MDIQFDPVHQKFFVYINEKEYSLEYNELDAHLWEFHCPFLTNIVTNLKVKEVQQRLIDYALHYMARNNIRLFESGSCHQVSEFLSEKKDLEFLIKYVV